MQFEFKQNNTFSGTATIHYNSAVDSGKVHLRVYDSTKPDSANWFESEDGPVKAGPGLTVATIKVSPAAKSPAIFSADTIEVTLLNEKGAVLTTAKQSSSMTWTKPK